MIKEQGRVEKEAVDAHKIARQLASPALRSGVGMSRLAIARLSESREAKSFAHRQARPGGQKHRQVTVFLGRRREQISVRNLGVKCRPDSLFCGPG